jgi:hypothetical protein
MKPLSLGHGKDENRWMANKFFLRINDIDESERFSAGERRGEGGASMEIRLA